MFSVIGLFVGVFYREFTKFYGFTVETLLGKLHVHTLVLGVVLTLIFYMLTKSCDADCITTLKKPIYIHWWTYFLDYHDDNYRNLRSCERRIKTCEQWCSSRNLRCSHFALSIGLVWTIVKIFQYESIK